MPESLIASVFASTCRILRRPAFLIPALVLAVACDATIRGNAWPVADIGVWPTQQQFTVAILVVLARGWLELTLIAVGIAVLRGQPPGMLRQWVHVLRAIKIGVVSAVLLVGVLLGTLLFVLPGVYLLLRWSQAVPAMIDGRLRVSDVLMYSEAIASAHYLRILVIWALAWGVPELATRLAAPIAGVLAGHGVPYFRQFDIASGLAWSAALHAWGLALIAALYVELDTRARVKVHHL